MSSVFGVTDATFEREVEGHVGLTLVDFWATWCGPCRVVAPIIDRLAAEYAGQAKIVKLDTDANPQVMARYAVRSIPTILFFKNGQLVDRIVGAAPRARIEAMLREHLPSHVADFHLGGG